jgi:hypothetical protein
VTIEAITANAHGTATLDNANQRVVFAPDHNFNGAASFDYRVSDGRGGSATARMNVNITAVNVNPLAGADGITVQEDGGADRSYLSNPVIVAASALLANDTDGDNDPLSLDWVGNGNHCTATLEADGSVRLVTQQNYYGAASFEYRVTDGQGGYATQTVSVNVTSVNDKPNNNGVGFFSYAVPYWTSGFIYPDDGDGGDAATLSYQIVKNPVYGSANLSQVLAEVSFFGEYYAFVGSANPWQFSYIGGHNGYTGPDPFTIRITDRAGAYIDVEVPTQHYAWPVALDLDRDGLEFSKLSDSAAHFDMNNDGRRERTAWVGADDGLLALDSQGDRTIDRFDEISFRDYLPGAATDLEGLRAFDSDGDGKLTANDQRWSQFGVWQDADQDGFSDAGEFCSLDEVGIASINLQSDGITQAMADGDVHLAGVSTFARTDGTVGEVGDAALRYAPGFVPAQGGAVPGDAEVARLVQQFLSDCAGAMVMPSTELDLPVNAAPLETLLAENVLLESARQMEQQAA